MTRARRLTIGIIAPPVIGALLVCVTYLVLEFDQEQSGFEQFVDVLSNIHWVVLIGFVTVGIQSIVCALVIEFHVQPQKLSRGVFVRTCVLLGSLSGQIPGYFLEMMERLLPIGAVVGAIMGLALYPSGKYANEAAHNNRMQSDPAKLGR